MTEEELGKLYDIFDDYIFSFGPKNSSFGEKKSYALVKGIEERIKEHVFPMIEEGLLDESFCLVTWVYERLLKYYYLYDYTWETLSEIICMAWFKIKARADEEFVELMNRRVWELQAEYNDIEDGALAIWCYLERIVETTEEIEGFLKWTNRAIDNDDLDPATLSMLVEGAAAMMEELGYPETEIERFVSAYPEDV